MEPVTLIMRIEKLIGDEQPFTWASRIGIPSSTFDRIWNHGGDIRAKYLRMIAEKTNVSLNWLVTGEGPMYRDQAGGVGGGDMSGSGLTEEERTLLAIYNDLSDESKDELGTVLQRLVDQEQDEKKKRVGLLEKLRKSAG